MLRSMFFRWLSRWQGRIVLLLLSTFQTFKTKRGLHTLKKIDLYRVHIASSQKNTQRNYASCNRFLRGKTSLFGELLFHQIGREDGASLKDQVVATLKKYEHSLPWTLDWKFRLQRIYKMCENLPSHLTGSSPFVQEPSNWQRLCPGPFRWYPLGHSNEQTVSTSLGPLVQEWSVITWAPTLRAGHFFSPGAAAENKFQIFFFKFLFHYLGRLNVSLDYTQRVKTWSKTR